jgi:hypothetical protein
MCRWAKTDWDEGSIRISYDADIDQMNQTYEPFYISSRSIPDFDERFLGYGKTRSSQVYLSSVKIVYALQNSVVDLGHDFRFKRP